MTRKARLDAHLPLKNETGTKLDEKLKAAEKKSKPQNPTKKK